MIFNEMHFTRFYNAFLEMPVNGENWTFDLTCDVIGLTWVNKIGSQGSSLIGLSNTVCRLSLGCVVLEILGGGGQNAPPQRGALLGRAQRGAD